MEINLSAESVNSSLRARIIQRLSDLGIPGDNLLQGQYGMISFAECNKSRVQELTCAILPSDEEVVDKDLLEECMIWLQWLMFKKEPKLALEELAKLSADQLGVCGAVWGNNDIAYRCRTCELDPTCAICVPCFEKGNHKDHDYSIIYTGGGCCDCGDITAWKREGFCSKHKGAEQIQPLPKHMADSLGPVIDFLLSYWKDKLGKIVHDENRRDVNNVAVVQKFEDVLTSTVVEMLLDFCKYSESLLSFISQRVYSSAGLLDILLKVEKFLSGNIVGKLHELLLKMLGEPTFKYEFAKVFVLYYPSIVNAAISESSDAALNLYPLLSTFSVQIFTVPTLTPRLVEEMNLMGVLLQCLRSIFNSCARDGRLQVTKLANLYETTLRVVEDIRFVISHSVVPKYLCHHRQDLVREWMRLLSYVQGMNTQKRETGSHIEDESESVHLPFVLCHSISNVLSRLVAGAFSPSVIDDYSGETFFSMYKLDGVDEEKHDLKHAKVGWFSQDSSFSGITGKTSLNHERKVSESFNLPSSVLWLFYECLRSIENWIGLDNTLGQLSPSSFKSNDGSGNNFLVLRRTLSRFRRSRYIFRSSTLPDSLECNQPQEQVTSSACAENMLEGETTCELEGQRALGSSSWPDITYDVSSEEISVHLPLHQLYSMMLLRALKECYGQTRMPSAQSYCSDDISRSSDFFGQILDGRHPHGFSAILMEHPLRIRVFCAQVHSGMWRRNGDAPILFSEWYRSVRWSELGQELDLFLLQVCAALAPADLYVQRILERFGLSSYLSLNLEQPSEREPILVAEMLTLLIQILKERRFCGLTTEQCLHRELVYKLSIGDATRSQLVKSLPRDLSKVDELQEVLDEVAEYSHPSGMAQGTYRLRSSHWKELDLYHPRWNSRDQQTAVERYLRFCNVSALTMQLPSWTKIYHPLRGIAKIATCKSLLQIIRAVLFYAVFTEKLTASRAPDRVLLTALHLLALVLDVCRSHKESRNSISDVADMIPNLAFASQDISINKHGDHSMLSLLVLLMRMHEKENAQNYVEPTDFNLSSLILNLIQSFVEVEPACTAKLQELAPQLAFQFLHPTLVDNARTLDLTSDNEMRKAKSRERQAAILERMRAQQSKFLENFNSEKDDEMDDILSDQEISDSVGPDGSVEPEVLCSLCHEHKSNNPVSFLVFLQKSRLLSFVDGGPPSWEQFNRSCKEHASCDTAPSSNFSPGTIYDGPEMMSLTQLEDLVQSVVNDFAFTGQPGEVNDFIEFTEARFPSIKNKNPPCTLNNLREKWESMEMLEEHIYLSIRESKSNLAGIDPQKDDNFPTAENNKEKCSSSESLLLGKYIAALPKEPRDAPSASQGGHRRSKRIKSESSPLHPEYDNIGSSGNDGIYVSSCGHAVHQGCLDRYLSSLRERYIRRIVFEGGHIVDPDQGEFLCPVCRGLANSVLPTIHGNQGRIPRLPKVSTLNMIAGNTSTSPDVGCSLRLEDGLSLVQRTASIVNKSGNIYALPVEDMRIANLEPIIRLLCGMYYPGQDKILETGRVSNAVILWNTLKYTLISTEIAVRSRMTSLSPNYDLGSLYKELNSSSGFILSKLLDITHSTRMGYLNVLLRYQGVQLFAKSLCCPTYSSEISGYSNQPTDKMIYILENSEMQAWYPDIQLWRLASEPIIAHDPFSSFMWMLFCLPWPMLSCKESYFSLVHVFYIVSMIQAIVLCHRRRQSIETKLDRDSLITDVYQVMGECPEAEQYFESYRVNPAYSVTDAIQSLTFPFLRRCALFWKLINRSRVLPFSYGTNSGTGPRDVDNPLNCANDSIEELFEVDKLKKFFNIPSVDFIINDGGSRSTALRWLGHFREVLGGHKCHRVLRCTPASPFKLMLLPRLYQDLLQRYIKKSCPGCGTIMEEPALCLLCGKLCSPNWKTCCSESGISAHAMACGAGMGVFLLIRRTTILLQRSARQANWPSPYLDAYGEEDIEMHRGKPLFLNEERYASLTHMVASHGIDRSSEVLRQTTIGSIFMF